MIHRRLHIGQQPRSDVRLIKKYALIALIAAGVAGVIWGHLAWVKLVSEAVAAEQVCRMVLPHFRKPDVCFGVLDAARMGDGR
jgi:hypothetical protein